MDMRRFWMDLGYGARGLRNQPGFAAIAILTLALGIGASTTIFSVIYNVLLDPFPYTDAKRVVAIHDMVIAEHGGVSGGCDMGLLEFALHRSINVAAYEKDGVAEVPRLAAAYCYGIVKNHPFIDGDKRAAAAVFELFLELNGYDLTADDVSTMNAVIALADGSLSERAFSVWIKDNIELEKPAPKPRNGRKIEP